MDNLTPSQDLSSGMLECFRCHHQFWASVSENFDWVDTGLCPTCLKNDPENQQKCIMMKKTPEAVWERANA